MRTLRPRFRHWHTIVPVFGAHDPTFDDVAHKKRPNKGVCSHVRVQCGLLGDSHKFKVP
ncbi:MAG: hypothetical protein BWY85_00557 [Firmicutes bacterium ADurb.Bin506]|nr:MAG: hypothetical protein BWY85_00557 [Firmicutes bacterium ADurb.Bin506]